MFRHLTLEKLKHKLLKNGIKHPTNPYQMSLFAVSVCPNEAGVTNILLKESYKLKYWKCIDTIFPAETSNFSEKNHTGKQESPQR